ncbi:MAG TPA: SMP-30/gluconolactonase/LRE family protein [Telluria sp.]|nr:SMP-30/gluconolactonase/LRE family protein [Telluria sp.]
MLATLLSACGGGGGQPFTRPDPATLPGLTVSTAASTATAGGTTVAVSAARTNSTATVGWSLAPAGLGALDAASGDLVLYTPPIPGAVDGPSTVTFKATLGTLVKSASLTLQPSAPGIYLVAGTAGGNGNLDGVASAARFDLAAGSGVAFDGGGVAYVADTNNHSIRRIAPDGRVGTLAGAPGLPGRADGAGTGARFRFPSGMAFDAAGNLWVADTGNGLVRKISPNASVSTVLALEAPRALAFDAAGKLYVAAGNRIAIVAPNGQTTYAGAAASGSGDGPAAAARFNQPAGLAVDAAGNLYVADTGNHALRMLSPAGVVSTIAGRAGAPGHMDGSGTAASFTSPAGLVLRDGRLYVSEAGTVRVLSGDLGHNPAVGTLAGLAGGALPRQADGGGADAGFLLPGGLAWSPLGYAIVTDSTALRRVDPAGNVATLAGALLQTGGSDGNGTAARFGGSVHGGALARDGSDFYVADAAAHTLRRFNLAGQVATVAGLAGQAGDADGKGDAARLRDPHAVAADGKGSVYVSDSGNFVVRRLGPDGTLVTIAGQRGQRGSADGAATDARFTDLEGLAFDTAGNVYVIDNQDTGLALRRIAPDGQVSTVFRRAGLRAEALVRDANGNFYLDDGSAVLRLDPAFNAALLAGQEDAPGAADGAGSAARFARIGALAVDQGGLLVALDAGAGTLRRISATGAVGTVAGTSFQTGATLGSPLPGLLPPGGAVQALTAKSWLVLGRTGIFSVVLP